MITQNKATIAHVGCGYWGKNIARNLSEIGHLRCVCDENPAAAQVQSDKLGVKVASFEDILKDPAINGATLATPAGLHAEQAIALMRAGKHVFVEKPMALSLADAQAMNAAAEETGKTLMVGHLLQYHAAFQRLRALIKSGEIGDLVYVTSNRLSMGKFRTNENSFWSFAPHDVSMVLSLVNEQPEEVTAQGLCHVSDGIEDFVSAQLAFSSGVKAFFRISWLHPYKEQCLVAMGTKGALVFEDSNPDRAQKLRLYPHSFDHPEAEPVPVKGEMQLVPYEATEPLKQECQHFVDCISQAKDCVTSGVEGAFVLDTLLRVETAIKEKTHG